MAAMATSSVPLAIRGISSMATRALLNELAAAYAQHRGAVVAFESVGGVDAARRVAAGEAFDVVVLAADAIDKLIAVGAIHGGRVDLVRSPVAVAVPAGAARPDIGSEEAVRAAVLAAKTIGYSTGPSGTFLMKLFERWGIADQLKARTVQAPAGVPVGALIARGEVALGFQQYSELKDLPGIDVLGLLPPAIANITTFSGAVCRAAASPEAAAALLQYLASTDTAATKRRHGMEETTT
jgi:molybdate transport system substrate-binding protein